MAHRNPALDAFDERDRALLTRLQQHVPLVPRPFAEVGRELGMAEADVVQRLAGLKQSGIVREFSAIFDARRLGYGSTLVAASYESDALEQAAEAISRHPGVSHNYERDHGFNLWYTLAVPPGVDVEDAVDALHRETGALTTRILPAIRVFKIGVRLDLTGAAGGYGDVPAPGDPGLPRDSADCSTVEMRAVRALQDDLPAVVLPFHAAAAREGFASPEELLAVAEAMRERGLLRRLAVVLRHRKAGFSANGMVAWNVPLGQCDAVGEAMARFREVSHCYQRPSYPDWPYSIFTMIHGTNTAEVEATVEAIRAAAGEFEHRIIYSLREFKKERVRYFVEREAGMAAATAPPA